MKGAYKMNSIIKLILPLIVDSIVKELLSPNNINSYGDKLFDLIEDMVEDSDNTIDDKTVLPIIKSLREGLSIPDDKKL